VSQAFIAQLVERKPLIYSGFSTKVEVHTHISIQPHVIVRLRP